MKKQIRKPYRIKRKKSILKNRFFWLGVLVLIISIGLFYLICFWDFFQVEKIEISGNQEIKTENIKNLIEKEISKKILFIPSKSIFLADLKMTEKNLLEKYPQIAEVNLERKFPRGLKVEIEERKPVAIFIQDEDSFFIDKEGVIFKEDTNNEMLKIKNLIFSEELKLGERVIEKEKLSQILEIETGLEKDIKVQIETAEIVSDRRLNVKTSEGWEIYFNLENDLDWQITELGLVLEKLEKQVLPGKRENLEYIDLRFDKISYKCR